MRALKGRGKWFLVAMVGACAWALVEAMLSAGMARPPAPSLGQSSDVFTPAHPSALASLKDFLNMRPQPVQPIAFTHQVHITNGVKCEGCHTGVTVGPEAGIPGVKFCMGCHVVIATDKPEIKKIAAYQARGEDISWARVYDYSPSAHVKFNHAPHIRAGVTCDTCHGDMSKQTVAQRAVDLTMGRCVTCHQQHQAPIDCLTCHI
jgi:formamidopyrimidine-DNA glycosylase